MMKSLKKIKLDVVCPPRVGEIVEGTVLNRERSALYVDLGAKGIGVIFGKEFFNAKNMLKGLETGDKITAKVTDLETEDGMRELSLMEASQEMAWKELAEAKESQESFDVLVTGANKGGLLLRVKNINGFLPTSQLLPEHFPKVEGADGAKIAQELQKLVGQNITIRIFDLNPAENKLIFSEKTAKREKTEEKLTNYQAGEVVEGEISGITTFGAFVVFGEGLEGLIPSAEIPSDEGNPLTIGKKVKAKIIEIAKDKIYLSIKQAE
ncbi:MAG: S1 RNA-binding domain-containing protein [Patescibacteria group bacterium]|nr:S1 RNA-binding domain-containing protein [Patescibacteria group bacterium]